MIYFSSSQAEECKGHVFFYNLEEQESETEADFAYFYNEAAPWFKERGISTSTHDSAPLKSNTCFENNVSIPKEMLRLTLGYVLLKPNKEDRVYGGVMTDMDLIIEANEFFN